MRPIVSLSAARDARAASAGPGARALQARTSITSWCARATRFNPFEWLNCSDTSCPNVYLRRRAPSCTNPTTRHHRRGRTPRHAARSPNPTAHLGRTTEDHTWVPVHPGIRCRSKRTRAGGAHLVRHLLHSIQRPHVVEGVDRRRQAAVKAEHLTSPRASIRRDKRRCTRAHRILNDGGEGEVVEQVGEVPVRARRAGAQRPPRAGPRPALPHFQTFALPYFRRHSS